MQKHSKCIVGGCECPGKIQNGVEYFTKGYCTKHYMRFRKHGNALTVLRTENTSHIKHPLYATWSHLKYRTSNPNAPNYHDYGGRGIKVCDRWKGPDGFKKFLEDMGERPENHSLDRIDNDGDYSPENCRWATRHQQCANKRNNNKTVGISWAGWIRKWVAQIMVQGKQKHLGYFSEYDDAVAARKAAEVQYNVIV